VRGYDLQFEKLCGVLQLGDLRCEPKPLTGGLLHRMYALQTATGKYAVKALNPQVMLRPRAMSDITNGERIAQVAARVIPALPAKQFDDRVIPEIDGQYYLVYDWLEGKPLYNDNISPINCEQIGAILGKLHTIDFSSLKIEKPSANAEELVGWDDYLCKGRLAGAPWVDELSRHLDSLHGWNQRYLAAMAYLESPLVIGHGDIDPKNVLWCGGQPIIIDWESAGYLNPAHELIVYAMYWADVKGKTNKEKLTAFFKGYVNCVALAQFDWPTVMDAGLCPRWLEYSLKRSLGLESADDAERQMGTAHVFGTLRYLQRYEGTIFEVVGWLREMGL